MENFITIYPDLSNYNKLVKELYYNEKELCAYTLNGSFKSEEKATKELLAEEYKIPAEEIKVVVEER